MVSNDLWKSIVCNEFKYLFNYKANLQCQDWMHESLSHDAIDPIDRKLKELLPFHIKGIVKGRVDKNSYKFFYSKFVSLIDKKSIWNEKLVKAKKESDLVTVSNEAFALVTLEGQWERWVDLYVKSHGNVRKDKTLNTRSISSSVPARYTRGI